MSLRPQSCARLQGRDPLASRPRGVGAVASSRNGDDLFPRAPWSTVAEDHRLEQRGPAEVVVVVDVDVGLYDPADGVDVAAFAAGITERRRTGCGWSGRVGRATGPRASRRFRSHR